MLNIRNSKKNKTLDIIYNSRASHMGSSTREGLKKN